ncbi:hypothetical protein [Alteromonas gilva]|uniref:PrkA AAA domain-containing protein n=1 Tax=Alteromonas gilva TaxID=2987522 RepID=A0ABT5L740_9ALTE|nr:hypothetical protein [Alteromonas gilva]MDC8832872.1 hypothetical protein [Alteromonas gilva]
MGIFEHYKQRYISRQGNLSVVEYLKLCKSEPRVYQPLVANLSLAFGALEAVYPHDFSAKHAVEEFQLRSAFVDFPNHREIVDRIYSAILASNGRQPLYFVAPCEVSQALLYRLHRLARTIPRFVIAGSPALDSPLSLFTRFDEGLWLEEHYGIPLKRSGQVCSSWLVERVKSGMKPDDFEVEELYPEDVSGSELWGIPELAYCVDGEPVKWVMASARRQCHAPFYMSGVSLDSCSLGTTLPVRKVFLGYEESFNARQHYTKFINGLPVVAGFGKTPKQIGMAILANLAAGLILAALL